MHQLDTSIYNLWCCYISYYLFFYIFRLPGSDGCVVIYIYIQDLLEPDAAHVVRMLLPDYVNGNLSALCVWPDQIRHWYRYRWTSPLHFIDTPDDACSFDYSSTQQSINEFLFYLICTLIDQMNHQTQLTYIASQARTFEPG